MVKTPITIHLSEGLDARPIALLVQEASQYTSKILIEVENKQINAKSIMGMMTLGLDAGEEVLVSAAGNDENDAIAEIEKYLSAK